MNSSKVCSVEVTRDELEDVELDSDLTIIYSMNEKLPGGEVIVRVGGEPYTDRGNLRVALSDLTATTVLLVEFQDQGEKVDLRSGVVETDGNSAVTMRTPSSWLDSDDDEELLPVDIIRSASQATPQTETHSMHFDSPNSLLGGGSTGSKSPQLLEFSTIDVTSQGNFDYLDRPGAHRTGLTDAIKRMAIGRCLIILSEMINPLGEIEIISKILRREYIVIDCALKMRQRPPQTQVLASFFEAMHKGRWFFITSGHKSLVTLRLIESAVAEARSTGFKGWHPSSRILIATNPHPHFPKSLMDDCVTLRFRASFTSSALHETMHSSVSKRKFIYGSVRSTDRSLAGLSPAAKEELGVSGLKTKALPSGTRRRGVQISTSVEIVEIPPREAATNVTKQQGPIAGGIQKVSEFRGAEDDKFLCISSCGASTDRLAVGSSMGNVYCLDYQGNSLSALHAHDASLWDLSCVSATKFVTGSEDGSAIRWGPQDGGTVQQKQVAKCGHDIFSVRYYDNKDENSPVFIGGLMAVVVGLMPKGQVKQVPVPSSTQAMEAMPQHGLLMVGGGDGTLTSININRMTAQTPISAHKKKLPCVAQDGENLIATGSFDSTMKLWDIRTPMKEAEHTVKLKNYVTGIAMSGNTLTASVGSSLYIWDLRNLSEIRSGMPNAWQGLSRGMVLEESRKEVVTASPDGVVRFWKYL